MILKSGLNTWRLLWSRNLIYFRSKSAFVVASKSKMEKSQREYYLNEQMKAIQKEMNDLDETPNEVDALQERIDQSGLSKEGKEKAENELQKIKVDVTDVR